MSKNELTQAPKGPSETNKGVIPPSLQKRWKTSNLSFATEKARRSKSFKTAVQDWRGLILLQNPGVPYGRLPANLRGAIVDLATPPSRPDGFASRRDRTGEAGEIVPEGITS